MKDNKNLAINIIVTMLYALFTLIMVFHHEIWADEAQAWLIAKNLSIFDFSLFKHLVNEGHPPFFYLLIMPFAKLNTSIIFMQILCWFCSVVSVFLLLKKSPFNNFCKFSIVISGGFLYFFPVIARSYSMIPLLIFIAAILYKKQDILGLKEKEMQKIRGAKIALIPQDPMTSLNPLYTIENQLLEVIKIHQHLKGDEARKKALEALEMVQIPCASERLKSYPHEFSGGMKQRAIIAMALACHAQILIADEPTTALDVTIQAQIMKLLSDIKSQLGTSVLLITHDLALVGENADEIAVMYAGRIVENAPAKEFFEKPNHPYSLALLNSIPSKRGETLETIHGQPPTIHQDISGCRFHPRCKYCFEPCGNEIPPNFTVGENHMSACFLNRC